MGGKPNFQCRLWWPQHLSLRPVGRMAILGWATNFSSSLDIVVATAFLNGAVTPSFSEPFLRAISVHAMNRLPTGLQELVNLSVIGEVVPSEVYFGQVSGDRQCSDLTCSSIGMTNEVARGPMDGWFWPEGKPECSKGGNVPQSGDRQRKGGVNFVNGEEALASLLQSHCKWSNGYMFGNECKFESSQCNAMTEDIWIKLSAQPTDFKRKGLDWIPKMERLRFRGTSCVPDIHLILYEQPKLASHHFSIRAWNCFSGVTHVLDNCSSGQTNHSRKPQWALELEKQQEAPDIDSVVLQLNCAAAVEDAVEDLVASLDTSCKRFSLSSILHHCFRHLVAATIALPATVFYILVQAGSWTLSFWPFVIINALCAKLLKHTWRNIRIRCHQITGWPIILVWRGCGRDQPNIAAAHRTALVRHSTWSAIIFDMVFGIISGVLLHMYHACISQWVRSIVRSLTDDILRTGCIWLMGVPAGFKLNTELAGTLGLLSLNVIQVWSTLLYLLKPAFGPFLHLLAITGMLFGITVPAAIVADTLFLATIHISSLYQIIAFLYSNQLQALAALWRLFRGRKRNYLRGRIDTYDFSVEQHVAGSLMFTPLLLLLPTTSVFYIFFTILYTSLSILRFSLQILIACFHCFPYAQVAIWLVKPRRFPSGVWFETLFAERGQQLATSSKVQDIYHHQNFSSADSRDPASRKTLVSILGIKTANLGELLLPYLRQLGGGMTWSACALCVYKTFSGERWPSSVELGMPALSPWTAIPARRFWWLCYDAVLASI